MGLSLTVPARPISLRPMSTRPMPDREPVLPDRVRTLPRHFAWADHRLRDRLSTLTPVEIALLFFLHLVADRSGLSFWADVTIAKLLFRDARPMIQGDHREPGKRWRKSRATGSLSAHLAISVRSGTTR